MALDDATMINVDPLADDEGAPVAAMANARADDTGLDTKLDARAGGTILDAKLDARAGGTGPDATADGSAVEVGAGSGAGAGSGSGACDMGEAFRMGVGPGVGGLVHPAARGLPPVGGPPARQAAAEPASADVTSIAPIVAATRPTAPKPKPEPYTPVFGSITLTATTIGAITALLVAANVVTLPWTRHVFDHAEQLLAIGMTVAVSVIVATVLSLLRKASNGVVLASATAVGITATTVLLISGVEVIRARAASYQPPHAPTRPQSATHPGSGRTGAWNDAGGTTLPGRPTGGTTVAAPNRGTTQPQPAGPATTPPIVPPNTTTKVPNPYLPAHDRVLLDVRPSATGPAWSDDDPVTGSCRPQSDGMRVTTNAARRHACLATDKVADRITDATAEISVTLGTAASAGLVLRQSGKGSWYAAGVDRAGHAWLAAVAAGAVGPSLISGQVTGFDLRAAHLVAVVVVGSTLTLHVDGQAIGSTSSAAYRSGAFGGFASAVSDTVGDTATGAVSTVGRLRVWTG
jgi:hypothetical protein